MSYPKIDECGNRHWYNDEGQRHREDGPAVEWYDGTKYWCINGKLHREDGPAVEWWDDRKEWYYNGEWLGASWIDGYTQEKFERYVRELKIKEYW